VGDPHWQASAEFGMLARMSTLVGTVSQRTTTVCLSLLLLGGCAYGELKQVLRAQVAAETKCGDLTVETTPMYQPNHKPGTYRVKGCDVDRTYECPQDDGLVSYGDKVCKPVAAAPATPPPVAAEPAPEDADPALEPAPAPEE
jgi:hypothetical protein